MKLIYSTVIYDGPFYKKFIVDYLSALDKQTCDGFHLLLILDDVNDSVVWPYLESYYNNERDITVIETNSIYSPFELRKLMISKAYEFSADGLIFSDFDETVATNRVEEVSKYLENYDFVFNDFFVTDENLQRTTNLSYFSKRKIDNILNDWECIRDFNFVGFGSMAINLNKINFSALEFPEYIKALDWFLATWILLNGGVGFKLENTFANYRQHVDSYIGFNKKLDKESLLFGLEVKKAHYSFFSKNSPHAESNQFKKLYKSTLELESRIINSQFLDEYISAVNDSVNYDDFCWWENIKLLEEKNANI